MTGTDLCVNKPHCTAAVNLERVKPQPPPSLLLWLEPVQSCLGVARMMSNYGYKKKSIPVIFEPPCMLMIQQENRHPDRLTGGHNVTLTLTVFEMCVGIPTGRRV